MTAFNSEKYKDERPARTVARIRSILDDLGILLVEQWFESAGLYSMRISIPGTGVGQNGKGVTQELALASAYGEFIERLQNRLLYPFENLAPEALTHGGFFIAPDEQPITLDELLASGNAFVQSMIDGQTDDAEVQDGRSPLVDFLRSGSGGDDARAGRRRAADRWRKAGRLSGCQWDFVGIPFYDVCGDTLAAIPYHMVRIGCGSNGTCAGNTPEEAILQGMSEILERTAQKRILVDGMVPPTVPRDYLSLFPAVSEAIDRIEKDFGYSLTVKDCSMGWGVPVIGLLTVNRNRTAYCMRLGAHASFEIALERCLTELFQGREVGGSFDRDMTAFDLDHSQAGSALNRVALARTGQGAYPRTLFSNSADYPFKEFYDASDCTNREMVRRIADVITEKGYPILVRDVSFLGFPSYHVLIPGMSEIFHFLDDRHRLKSFASLPDVAITMRDLNGASVTGLKKTALYLIDRLGFLRETDNLQQLLGFPVDKRLPWHRIHPWAFTAALQWRLGRAKAAHGTMAGFVESLQKADRDEELTYYRCVRDLLGASVEGMDRRETVAILGTFYPDEVLSRVLEKWGTQDHVLSEFPALPCYRCQNCDMREGCAQPFFRDLEIKLKERMKRNPPDQTGLRKIFHRETEDAHLS